MSGENLYPLNKNDINYNELNNGWYKTETEYNTNLSLIELIDNFLRPSSNLYDESILNDLGMSITDIYREQHLGFLISGKILSGSLIINEQILIQPLNLLTKIKNILHIDHHNNNYKHNIAIAGDNIQLQLIKNNIDNELYEQINIGDMITLPYTPIRILKQFECKIFVMKNIKIPICKGHSILIYTQSISKPAYIYRIKSIINKKNGNILKKKTKTYYC